MSKRTLVCFSILALVAALSLTAGCKGKQQPVTDPTPAPPPAQPEPQPEPEQVQEPEFKEPPPPAQPIAPPEIDQLRSSLKTVFFAYDKHDLSDDTRRILRENAAALRSHGNFSVVIQGHCDERGTIEYNLALGERRANAVREFLAGMGITAARMRIVSYGEERPAARGSNEAIWAQNRRAEFVVE